MEPIAPIIDDERLDAAEVEVLDLLLRDYGFDYRRASAAWLKRALRDRVAAEELRTIRGLREKARHDEACRRRLLRSLEAPASVMFQEPAFYRAFRERVVPLLRTYPFVRIWHAGCATGEAVYSMAILLEEAGLYDRCRLYATDVDEVALREARDGIVPLATMREHTANYLLAGGERDFSRYYTAGYERAIFRASLKRNLIFARHDLGIDGPFNDFHAVVCRDSSRGLLPAAHARAGRLILGSLVRFGFLCVAEAEALAPLGADVACEVVDAGAGIYRRVH